MISSTNYYRIFLFSGRTRLNEIKRPDNLNEGKNKKEKIKRHKLTLICYRNEI